MNHDAGPLDTSIDIVTPENIAFSYRLAGPFRRLPAYLIDLAIRMGVALGAGAVVMVAAGIGLGGLALGAMLALWFVLAWFYGGLFETFWNGQTPGKRVMRIRVVSVDGRPITGMEATLRNVLRIIDGQPSLAMVPPPLPYLLGLVSASMNERFQRLGDLACRTMVVVEQRERLRPVMPIHEPEAIRLSETIPANFVASRTLGLALSAYAHRRTSFSRPRCREIARHLAEPLAREFNLPPATDPDLLLCAVYRRVFLTGAPGDRGAEPVQAQLVEPLDIVALTAGHSRSSGGAYLR